MRIVNILSGTFTAVALASTAVLGVGIQLQANESRAAELKCLADNIYFEALIETEAGQIAVGNVTMNRVNSKHFPNTVCDVVWERKQFSWTHDGKSDVPKDKEGYKRVYKVAEMVYDGTVSDITEGSTFYHADYVNPSWNKVMTRVGQIDTHIFYTYKGR